MVTKAAQRKAEKAQYFARRIKALLENRERIRRNTCPKCGSGLRRNLSLSGWYQCHAYGAPGFQTGDGIGKPDCSFQFFFDPTREEREELDRMDRIGVPA